MESDESGMTLEAIPITATPVRRTTAFDRPSNEANVR